ncbi:hypothetical protein EPA93_06010 [Ktedonosporobacter rubrisoli]|uniref:Uncharacterized protein n=1 Tax=Ktedonosporobacter rubrisoli TaxID=2509675 RepID=A0A4V0YYA9_KTERU|nr:hypothetical protein [Ktedonosporobacter rubrisoli]QBD75581.1 hypothetical protein EPA93_06010 [Ktedonosporobacter rubrisoli]
MKWFQGSSKGVQQYYEPTLWLQATCNEVIALNFVLRQFLDYYSQPGHTTVHNRELIELIEHFFERSTQHPLLDSSREQCKGGRKE